MRPMNFGSRSRLHRHAHIPHLPVRKFGIHLSIFLSGFAFLGLTGCAAKRLQADYAGYESAYATTSNRELLLNLARLNNHDPTFFFKMGQIGTSYRMTAAVNGGGNYVTQGTASGTNVTGGGTTTLGYEKDPTFQFIPVNDDATAQLLLKPVPAELFYALYQQGWRVDQLFRLMVDRIEIREPNSGDWEVIRNLPAQDNKLDYTRFLRISALAYELQKRGYLLLRGRGEFQPLARGAEFAAPPKPEELLAAQAKNLVYRQRKEDGKWELGQETVTAEFRLNGESREQIIRDMPEMDRGGIAGVTALQTMLAILKRGFTIQQDVNSAEPPAGSDNGSAYLVMRSMIGLMTAAAQEQEGFDDLLNKNPMIDRESFKDLVPPIEQRPLLRIVWSPEDDVLSPLVQLSYENKMFMVTDRGDPKTPEEMYWNRDLFRLISQITAQVTVDISKFPLPSLLQLHTD